MFSQDPTSGRGECIKLESRQFPWPTVLGCSTPPRAKGRSPFVGFTRFQKMSKGLRSHQRPAIRLCHKSPRRYDFRLAYNLLHPPAFSGDLDLSDWAGGDHSWVCVCVCVSAFVEFKRKPKGKPQICCTPHFDTNPNWCFLVLFGAKRKFPLAKCQERSLHPCLADVHTCPV